MVLLSGHCVGLRPKCPEEAGISHWNEARVQGMHLGCGFVCTPSLLGPCALGKQLMCLSHIVVCLSQPPSPFRPPPPRSLKAIKVISPGEDGQHREDPHSGDLGVTAEGKQQESWKCLSGCGGMHPGESVGFLDSEKLQVSQ